MACAGSRELDIDHIRANYTSAHNRWVWANADFVAAKTHWNLGEDHEAIYDLYMGCIDLVTGTDLLTFQYDPFYPDMPIPHFLEFHTGENGAVDMDAILSAMWESKEWQTLLFVTRIDAMRGSISEKTVTEKAMADQLRHFL